MTLEYLKQLLTLMSSNTYRITGDWIMTSCPLAPYRHYKKTDSNPSFGISISDGASTFNCFSCNIKGRLSVLPNILMFYKHPRYEEIRKFIATNEPLFFAPSTIPNNNSVELLPAIPDDVLLQFKKFKSWGKINADSIAIFELRADFEMGAVVYPIRDKFGRLVGLKKRFKGKKFIEDRTYTTVSPKKGGVWYGIHLVDYSKPVYLVEGERDAILLHQEGLQAISSMGASISKQQMIALKDFKEIICFFDNDDAGSNATKEVLKHYPNAKVILYYGAKDPAELVEQGRLKNFIFCLTKDIENDSIEQ